MEINKIYQGDSLEVLKTFPANSIDCVITSPPYWGLRDYGTSKWVGGDINCKHKIAPDNTSHKGNIGKRNQSGNAFRNSSRYIDQPQFKNKCVCGAKRTDKQLGLEKTPKEFVSNLVKIFQEIKRVLKKEGTIWLNLGDSYATQKIGNINGKSGKVKQKKGVNEDLIKRKIPFGLKSKDLVGIPWRVAFALQADGWYLRQDIIWSKPNPMPESVTDRCTKSHEYIFLLTKSSKYYFDSEAIQETATGYDERKDLFHKHEGHHASHSAAVTHHPSAHSHLATHHSGRHKK